MSTVLGDGKLYGFGYNYHGQLGTGDSKSKHKLTKISFFDSKSVKKVCCGASHSLFQMGGNSIYSCGDNQYGRLCLGDSDSKNRKIPEKIPSFVVRDNDEVEDIFVGAFHSVFRTKLMEVYSGGYNGNGQLGLGDRKDRLKATKVILPEKIISVTCGGYHTFFISINGNIFGTGSNYKGQLGLKSDIIILTPVKIPFFKEKFVLQIACGDFHSIFICSDHEVYATGENDDGELGIGNRESKTTPVLLSSLKNEKIISVKCGGSHTLFLSKKKMFLVGNNSCGQLGNSNLADVHSPFLFSIKNKKIIQSLLLSYSSLYFTKKEVFGCGKNSDGELFNGKRKYKNTEVMKICDLKVKNHQVIEETVLMKKERFEYILFIHEEPEMFGVQNQVWI